jgi:cystathionine beta-lyase/cystathionine gamma-synthase
LIENFERAILPNTTLIYLESPNSWDYALQDLKAVAELAKAEGIVTVIDNSYCTPLYQQPYLMGIDLVLQSATKYISGHSDVVAGVLSGSKEMITRIFNSEYMNIGSGIQPFNAWLLIRGLRTLPMRLAHISTTTHEIVRFLQQHPQVEEVIFPLDESFPQYELARQQMTGACGLLTFVVKAENIDQIEQFCNNLQHILMAVSWGGYESLIIPKCSGIRKEDFIASSKEHRMLRLYVGQESSAYIISDLERGFEAM